jgi:subtilisin family serine protease
MVSRRILRILFTAGVLLAITARAASAANIIVQTAHDNVDINVIAASLGGTVLDSMPGNNYLLSVPSIPTTLPPGVTSIEIDSALTLPRFKGALIQSSVPQAGLPWYAAQPAMQLVRGGAALQKSTGRGVIIADIDSAVDVSHPALRGHLTTGHDFLNGKSLAAVSTATLSQSTASFLDQSTAAILDQSTASFLDQSTASFLDQSTASFLDQSTASFLDQSTASFLDNSSPGHGHATMVAGILVALAPDALIMPLRVFDDTGTGDSFQIAKAIRYAVQNGAQVINLSLGLSDLSPQVNAAVDFAIRNNVVVVSAAGNRNSGAPQWPAALPGVIGVAATDLDDVKATFSNYGVNAFTAAPGVNIITAYPGGYAIASGTSFSSAFVAAEAALIRSMMTAGTEIVIAQSSVNIDPQNTELIGQLGSGRVDFYAAVTIQIQTNAGSTKKNKVDDTKWIVIFDKGAKKSDKHAAAFSIGAVVDFDYDIVDAVAITVSAQKLNGIQHNPHVVDIVPDRPVFAFGAAGDGGTNTQTVPVGVARVGAPTATSNGAGIGVAIMDSGIDFANSDLKPSSLSFSAYGSSCQDNNGHGTHVAGIVGALDNTVGVVGVAPSSTLYCVKVLDDNANGNDSTVLAGLDWIYKNANLVVPPIRVVNMSFGRNGTLTDNAAYRTAIQQLYNMGIVIVVAAGNDQTQQVTQRVPATYPEVFAVASTVVQAGNNTACNANAAVPADSASYFTTDGQFDPTTRIGVTISAPGEEQEVWSTTCTATSTGILSTKLGGGTIRYFGTSMSAPHVAGVVARMMQLGQSGVENIRTNLRATASKPSVAPLNSPVVGYTFDGEREGIAKAP